jgi:hypothetical protein
MKRRETGLWVKALVGVGVLVVASMLVYGMAVARMLQSPPKLYKNHGDQIAADLRAHGMRVMSVYIDGGPWDPTSAPNYVVSVRAHVPETSGSTPVPGRVVCRTGKTNCWYQISALGVGPRNLPDLDPAVTGAASDPVWLLTARTMLTHVQAAIGGR